MVDLSMMVEREWDVGVHFVCMSSSSGRGSQANRALNIAAVPGGNR